MIYADNAATTRISPGAFDAMLPFLRESFGNPSGSYPFGHQARRAIEQARAQVAVSLGAHTDQIVFTSGGTEANHWVLWGVVDAWIGQGAHIITSAIEHPSILNSCIALEKRGIRVTYLPVNAQGIVDVSDVHAALAPDTRLVSIMLANNEIGAIQPISEISRLLADTPVLFHTDAVQATGHIPIDINVLGVDFLSASAHKFNGPKGTGILYQRNNSLISPVFHGGLQEHGRRAGTENVAGIVAAGCALSENIVELADVCCRVRELVEITTKRIHASIPDATIHGGRHRLPGIINIGFPGVSGQSLMELLALKGICVSTGSSCSSGKSITSHVLTALGLSKEQALSAIRITYDKYNTTNEAAEVATAVVAAYKKIIEA